ncbi:MAG: gliding motility-associated C-terminal domain-containing protein, partial [Bacteroidota bacterium]|nr:gliding motility-associated C-terminal domain-containing protein [Bacteroidota bacterium]
TTDTYSYNNLTTTTAYRAYVQNAVCPALYSNTVTINVVQAVTPANAGTDQQLCNVTSATLNGNTPSSGTGTWSFVSGPSAVSFTNPNDPNTTINGLTAGTYQLAWTISNNICSASQDVVQITVYPPTVAGSLAAAATVCATANAGTLSLTGYVSSVVRWEYSTNSGASWNNIASTTDTYSYNNLTTTTAYRAYVQNAVCPALYSNTVTINVVQAVTPANAGADQQLCNVTSATLNGNTPSSGTGTWSFVSGPSAVSFTNPNDPNTTINGLTAGTYQLAWTVSNNICSASQDLMQITISPATNSGKLVADAFVCIAGNDGNLSLSGYTGTIIRWEQSVDNGTTWTNISNTSNSYTYKNLQLTTQYRALVQSGICSSEYSNTVTIHVYQLSVGGKLLPNQGTVCVTANSGILQLAGFTGTIQQWESSVDSGKSWTVLPYTDTSYTYTSLATTTWFRVLIKNGSCSASYSDTARIQVDAATVAGTLSGGNILCSGINSGALRLNGRKGTVIHWEYSTDNGNNWNLMANTNDSLLYNNLTTNTLFRVLIKNGACAVAYSNSILITVVPPVTIADAGQDKILCNADNATILQANTPVNGAGTWSQASGPSNVSFINPSLPNTMVTGLRTGTYRFVWSISNGICANSTDTVTIKVDRVLSAFTLSSINDCGKTTYRFNNTSQSVFGIKNYQWYTSTGDTMLQKNVTLSYTTEGERNMALAVESNTGCSHKTEAIYKVVVYEFPQANINAIADACRSQLFQASADVNSKDSIAYILWNLGNGNKPMDSIVSVQYMSDGNYTVKLTVATVNRCFDSAFKQISVHPIPVVRIDTKPVVCRGDSAILSANGAMNYIWTDQDNRIICDGCTTARVKPTYNSTYKVLGYDQYGCSQITTTEVRVIQPLKMIASLNDTICVGQSRQLFAKGAGSYSWYPETGLSNSRSSAPVARPTVTTTYQVVGKDNYDCFTDSAKIRITVGNPTRIHIGNDTTVVAGGSYQLLAKPEVQDIRKWYWSGAADFSCKTCPDPTVKVTNDASIYCLAINAYGCTSTDTLSIKTFCPSTDVFIPNAFSPDGDGINDVLMVQGKGIKMIKSFRIFNRWGEVVFEKTNFLPGDPAYAWDGKIRGNPAPPDVFVYVCEVICEKGVPSIFKGNTAVLK